MQSQIIQRIVNSPNDYKSIIENASFFELKEVFTEYKQHYTNENVESIMLNYPTESELRDKLLNSSQRVIATLSKKYKEI